MGIIAWIVFDLVAGFLARFLMPGRTPGGIVATIVLGIVGTFIILKIVDSIMGIRATAEEEIGGLDLGMHGEEGYNLDA